MCCNDPLPKNYKFLNPQQPVFNCKKEVRRTVFIVIMSMRKQL